MKKTLPLLFFAFISLFSCTSPPKEIAEAYFSLGNSYYNDGDYEQAIEYYKKAEKYKSNTERLYYNLAMAYIHTQQYQEAEKLLKQLEEKDKNNIKVLSVLGYLEASKKNYEKAEEYYIKAIEISPYDEKLYHNMAVFLAEQGREKKALEYSEKAYTIKQDEKKIKVLYAYLNLKNNPDDTDALMLAEEAARADQSNTKLLFLLVYTYEKKEKYADAVSLLNIIIATDKENREALFDRARMHLLYTGETKQGLEDLKSAMEKGYDNQKKIQQLLNSPLLLAKKEAEEILSSASK
ncbi:tetratricopeptide repeat protein [Spirochaetia bacterium 38H-sp]|uniref:Tetratricopeptide repeat protein n=1 Tax=Rarispira pelagica TaxID=3141764 RepID=A0ABU9UEX3_9SPIR